MVNSENQGVFNKKKYQRNCKECKEPFTTNRKDRRYCCDKCRNKNWVKLNPRIAIDKGGKGEFD